LVERRLKENCRADRARIQIGRISNFGLLEMSRQRLRESTVKWKVSLTDESFSIKILKIVETKSILNKAKYVELRICEKLSNFMKENFLEDLKYFETKNKIKIDIIHDNSLIIPEYKIDFKNRSKKTIEKIESLKKLTNLKDFKKENNVYNLNKKIKKNTFKKKNFYKKKFYKKKVK
jgi:ribonuclease E